jgi:hypothetical protein
MGILTFFLNNKTYIVIALLGLVIAGQTVYITVLRSQKDTLVAEKQVLQISLDASQASLLQLKNDIVAQNAAIEKLKTESDARLAKNAVEVKKAQAVAQSYKRQAEDLLNRPPPQDMSKCDAAEALINEELANARK